MAAADLDHLFESLLHLSPAERERVKEHIDQLGRTLDKPGRFGALSGVISPADAELMRRATEDCERVDPGGW